MLQVVLGTARAISTRHGAAAAEERYNEASEFLSDSYQDLLGVPYSGTLWDYLDVYTELDIDWVPHFLVWREGEAKRGTLSYVDWLKNQGLDPKKRRALETTTAESSCACPVPPVDCRTGGNQDPMSCMEWNVQDPVRVEELIENGSFEDGVFVTVDTDESYSDVCDSCDDTLPGWKVEGTVNRHNKVEWPPHDGKYSIDLLNSECTFGSENSRGSLQQSFSTVVGDEYICSLWILAPGNPGEICNLDKRTVNITIGNTKRSFTVTPDVDEWENRAIPFTATSATTTIKIEHGDPPPAGFWGVAVDSVSCKKHVGDAGASRYSFVPFLESCFVDETASMILPSKSGLLPMGVDFLVNAAAVENLVKEQGVRNAMYAIKTLSCDGRVTAFAEQSFADANCTSPYTYSDEALYGCTQSLNCGTAGHPIRAKNKRQPNGFYFKDAQGKCRYISWQDLMNGGEWCGGS